MKPIHGHSPGHRGSRTYRAWIGAKQRCYNPRYDGYGYYGGRGIRLFSGWVNCFQAFLSYMGECPAGATLGRIDNERDCEPGNCRWEAAPEQARNKRSTIWITFNGRKLVQKDWERELGLSLNTLSSFRRYHGFTPEESLRYAIGRMDNKKSHCLG